MRSALSTVNRYPYVDYGELAGRIATFHGVKPERVLLGCGSTEILRVAAAAFLGRGKQLLQASPTFEAIENYARLTGAEVVSMPLDRTFAHDLDAMLAHAKASTALVYICNPNNPTASITPRKDLDNFIGNLQFGCCVLIDEAYHQYAGQSSMYASFIEHPLNTDRVIVCRTFSTVYGLAGIRLGYCVAAPATIQRMRPYITFDSVNSIVVRAATAALEDRESVREFVKRNMDARQEFFNQAMARMLKPIDSHANFVMMNTYHPAEEVVEHFRKERILVRGPFAAMDTYVCVSLGAPEEMLAFWRAWDKLPYAKAPMHH
jgi:histidinol-phosphate aminotransferase